MNTGSPPPADVILLHGMWGNAATLEPLIAPMQQAGVRIFRPTLPHHEKSLSAEDRAALGQMGIATYVEFLTQYIEGLQLTQPPILIGHSMGGLLAQKLASAMPTAALVLLAPANPAGINCITPWGILATSNALLHILTRQRLQRPWPSILNLCLLNDLPSQQRAGFHDSFLLESVQSYIDIVFWFLQKNPPSAVPRGTTHCPVLILGAGKDHLIRPGVVRRIARRYPRATLEFLPKCGHMMLLGEPGAQVGERVVTWLRAQGLTV